MGREISLCLAAIQVLPLAAAVRLGFLRKSSLRRNPALLFRDGIVATT